MQNANQIKSILPANTEVESYVLGAMLLSPAVVPLGIKHLKEDCFSVAKYVEIFKAMQDLYQSSQPIDVLTVYDKAQKLNYSQATAYEITSLTSTIFTDTHFGEWVNILTEYAYKRNAFMYAQKILQTLSENTDTTKVEAVVNEGVHAPSKSSILNATEVLFSVLDEYNELCETKSLNAYGTKPEAQVMAELVGYWQPASLVIVGGRPGMGKTAFTKLLTTDFVKKGKKVLFISLEMSKTELAHRYVHELINMDKAQLARTIVAQDMGTYVETTQTDIATAWGKMFKPNGQDLLYISDVVDVTVEAIRADIALMKAMHPDLEAVIVDYLQLINPSKTANRNYNKEQEISHISRSLKKIAKEFNIVVFCLSQLNRAVEGRSSKKPSLADLRDSGAIEQDADVVLFLYRAESYGDTEIECEGEVTSAIGKICIINAKNRHGSTGEKLLGFNGKLTKIYELGAPLQTNKFQTYEAPPF